jgi:hypothetical protein
MLGHDPSRAGVRTYHPACGQTAPFRSAPASRSAPEAPGQAGALCHIGHRPSRGRPCPGQRDGKRCRGRGLQERWQPDGAIPGAMGGTVGSHAGAAHGPTVARAGHGGRAGSAFALATASPTVRRGQRLTAGTGCWPPACAARARSAAFVREAAQGRAKRSKPARAAGRKYPKSARAGRADLGYIGRICRN